MPKARADFSQLRQLARKVGKLTLRNQTPVLMAGMDAETAAIARDAANRAPVDEGDLRASISNLVKPYKQGSLILGFIGPRKGYFGGRKRKGSKRKHIAKKKSESVDKYDERNAGKKRPEWYAHLVEHGHRSVHGGVTPDLGGPKRKGVWNARNKGKSLRKGSAKATGFVPPKPFLRPAFEAGKARLKSGLSDTAVEAMRKEFQKLQ